jgi:hypothetical protein
MMNEECVDLPFWRSETVDRMLEIHLPAWGGFDNSIDHECKILKFTLASLIIICDFLRSEDFAAKADTRSEAEGDRLYRRCQATDL